MIPPPHSKWIEDLCQAAAFEHPVSRIELLETHISWVILTGDYAYKIKKPVNLGFLDFTTLEKRKWFCEEELRLNQRIAPQIYLRTITINEDAAHPRVNGNGKILDYAVQMRQFPQAALAATMLADGTLHASHIDAFAARIAAFHGETGIAAMGSPYGTQEAVISSAKQNFAQLAQLLPDAADQSPLAALRAWSEKEYHTRWTQFGARQSAGCVRECHGDLHLGNIVLLNDELVPFDCLEFSPELRWIDVMNEVAFVVMDLIDRKRSDLGWRFLNAYLESTGDYGGICVLRYYLVYRALVRAKVHAIRAQQSADNPQEQARLLAACREYVALATRFAYEAHPALVAMHGLSGSGKTFASQGLLEAMGAIRIRSDVERKRQHGMATRERGGAAGMGAGIYGTHATQALYDELIALGRWVLDAGYVLILDAAFLKRWQRALAIDFARTRNTPFVIATCHAPQPVLHARVATRSNAAIDASDAGTAVLTHQLTDAEALTPDEQAAAIYIDTDSPEFASAIRAVCDKVALALSP